MWGQSPKTLGLSKKMVVERAHRLSRLQPDRRGPRPVIACFLNYCDKTLYLQKFRTKRDLRVEGYEVLLFPEYWVELSKRRKLFSKIGSQLHQKQIKFTRLCYMWQQLMVNSILFPTRRMRKPFWVVWTKTVNKVPPHSPLARTVNHTK